MHSLWSLVESSKKYICIHIYIFSSLKHNTKHFVLFFIDATFSGEMIHVSGNKSSTSDLMKQYFFFFGSITLGCYWVDGSWWVSWEAVIDTFREIGCNISHHDTPLWAVISPAWQSPTAVGGVIFSTALYINPTYTVLLTSTEFLFFPTTNTSVLKAVREYLSFSYPPHSHSHSNMQMRLISWIMRSSRDTLISPI